MTYKPEYREQAKAIIRKAIAERPMGMIGLVDCVDTKCVPYSRRATNEAAWSMVDDGEAFWNNRWLLELTKEKK
jgi:hypothetical protein